MHDVVNKLIKALPKSKDTPLSSNLAHLYDHFDFFLPEEMVSWEAQERISRYRDKASDSDS